MNKTLYNYKKQFFVKNNANFIGAIITLLIFVGIQIAIAFILQIVLDVANGGTLEEFYMVMGTFAFVMIVMVVTMCGKKFFVNHFIKKALKQYKNHVFDKMLDKNINSFHKESSSIYLSAFSNDLASIEQNYLRGTFQIIMQAALFIGGISAMAYYNWKIFLGAMIASLLPILISVIYSSKLMKAETNVSEENSSFLALLKDLLAGFAVIKSFKVEREIFHKFTCKNEELEQTKKNRSDINDSIEILNTVAGLIVELTVFGLGVYFALKGIITAGVVVAFIQLLNYVLGPISSLGQLIVNRRAALALIDKHKLLAEANDITEGSYSLTSFQEAITYEHVSFGYEENIKNLQNINLRFEKNKSYAIVGGSGSGKSTLLNLLLGYHNNYEGRITIDNHDLKDVTSMSLYDMVSIIGQNVFVFDNSIAENISLLKEFDEKLLEYAINCSGLSELIEEKGADYRCGENGSNLSGGEKQRISIARCLIRQTPILLMDEATAALDNLTSKQVEEAVLGIKELTKIIITHKMEEQILRKYDEIIVLNQGVVVEQGTFEELMNRNGYFYSLYEISGRKSLGGIDKGQ